MKNGCTRRWCLTSNQFLGKNGKVTGVEVEEVEWTPATDGGRPTMNLTGKKEVIEADMVLLAMGFLKPEQPKFAEKRIPCRRCSYRSKPRSTGDGRRTKGCCGNRCLSDEIALQ